MNSSDPGASSCSWRPGWITSSGVLAGDMPLNYYFTRITMQLVLCSITGIIMQQLLKPLGQTRYISSLIGGLILGPTIMGRVAPDLLYKYLFPVDGAKLLEMYIALGVCFWYFLMGAQIHIGPVMRNVSRKAAWIGMTSMTAPLLLAYVTSFTINMLIPQRMHSHINSLFIGMYFITTTVSVLAGNIVDHRLLGTEMGNLAMTSALFTAIATIMPLNLLVWGLPPPHGKPYYPHWKLLSGATFLAFLIIVGGKVVNWIARQAPNEEDIKEYHVTGVILLAVISATITDSLGGHITAGSFFAGLILPHSALTTVVTKRLEDFNTMVLMPPFFIGIGQSIDLFNMFSDSKGWAFTLMLLIIYMGKISLIAFTASWYSVPLNEGLSIGFLMCSRGILDILLLSWARQDKLSNVDDQEFAIMLFGIMVTNLIIGPAISFLYDQPLLLRHKGSRAIQELKPDAEFRILGCIYNHHTIPSLLNLIKSSHSTRFSPINLNVLHLVHATSRESSVQQQSLETGGFVKGQEASSVNATFSKHKLAGWVNLCHRTQLSSYSTMPEHICNAAEACRATFLIVPFHIRRLVGSHSGVSSDPIRNINLRVLESAPCSVGVLVDTNVPATLTTNTFHNVVVLFFGGPDDREALTYACRMAQHEAVRLTVVRFTAAETALTVSYMNGEDLFIQRFKFFAESKRSITFLEQQVGSGADTVAAIHGIGDTFDLFIVGRRHGPAVSAQMLSGLEAWSEYPEMGTVGDLLVSSDFKAAAVLVVQQYSWAEDYEAAQEESRGHGHEVQQYERQSRQHLVQEQPVSHAGHLRARKHNATRQNGVQFDEYGWNWNMGAGF